MSQAQRYNHASLIFAVRACYNDDATDLVALAGEQSVDVLQVSPSIHKRIASFHIGSRITALAWSCRTVSPSASDEWFLELVAADAHCCLHLLKKSHSTNEETIFDFGGGLSGDVGRTLTGVEFCGGRGEDSYRYVATVSDDNSLTVWDLKPSAHVEVSSSRNHTPTPNDRFRPTANVIPFSHPLTAIASHPSSSKEFIVADSHGSVFLVDWRIDPMESGNQGWRRHSVLELIEPKVLASTLAGKIVPGGGSVAWRRDAVEYVCSVYGSVFSVWDTSRIHGGKPHATGALSEHGRHVRWCPSEREVFAISTQSRAKGASLQVYNTKYIQAPPIVVHVAQPPHIIRDFDFMRAPTTARVVVALGKELLIFEIDVES